MSGYQIHAAKELSHGIVEDDPGIVHRVNEGGDAAISCRRKGISGYQHICPHINGVRRQYGCRAIDEICIPSLEAGDQFTGGRSLDAVEVKFVVEAGRKQPPLSRRISIRVHGKCMNIAFQLMDGS